MMSKKNRIKAEHESAAEKVRQYMAGSNTAPFAVLSANKGKKPMSVPEKAFKMEIASQLKEAHMQFFQSECAVILWVLHAEFGWGPARLCKFFKRYKETAKQLTDFYDVDYDSEEASWFIAKKLKEETGIDVYKHVDGEIEINTLTGRDARGRFVKREVNESA